MTTPPTPCRPGNDPPSPRGGSRKREERGSPPAGPGDGPACAHQPSKNPRLPPPFHRGLDTVPWDQPEKSGSFSGTGSGGGGGGPAPASSTAPSCALSITPDFDPELQSRLAGRGLRTGHPRIRSLPLGDRTLHPQQLPHLSRSLAHPVSGGVLILGGSRTRVLPVSAEKTPL